MYLYLFQSNSIYLLSPCFSVGQYGRRIQILKLGHPGKVLTCLLPQELQQRGDPCLGTEGSFSASFFIWCKHILFITRHDKRIGQSKKAMFIPLHSPFDYTLCKKATIHQVTTMLATSKNGLFQGHNHLLTTGTDDPTL